MSPPGIPTPEQALEDLKEQRRILRSFQLQLCAAGSECDRLQRAVSETQMVVARAESTLKLAVQEAVANEPAPL